MKKKLLAVVLCGAMALSMLAGCGGKKEDAPAADANAEAEAGDVADAANRQFLRHPKRRSWRMGKLKE